MSMASEARHWASLPAEARPLSCRDERVPSGGPIPRSERQGEAMRTRPSCRLPFLASLAILALSAVPPAADAQSVAELAAYQGPDRTQRLIAGAKKERAVSIYGSTVAED